MDLYLYVVFWDRAAGRRPVEKNVFGGVGTIYKILYINIFRDFWKNKNT